MTKTCGYSPAANRQEKSEFDDSELLMIQRPAQYLGGEFNAVDKTEQEENGEILCHIALVFPDTYEVGMSHLGLQILYEVLNRNSRVWAERVFMPQPDMAKLLRSKRLKLGSLESNRSLCNFDIVGFSLQYELCATNVLAILNLGGLSFLSAERETLPLIIGGGPLAFHPEALAPFFDAFFIGDAEEAISEIASALFPFQRSPGRSKETALHAIDQIEGTYVPAFYDRGSGNSTFLRTLKTKKATIRKRLLPSLDSFPHLSRPIVPTLKIVHNRLSIEVMRGCVRGCRFCQAGYIYRPQRERSPESILSIAQSGLKHTGFEEMSLLSLSTADYCSIVPLLQQLMDRTCDEKSLSISFPSTRVDAMRPELLEQIQRVRRTNFTLAPEAGTQRLRDVINKGVSDDDILRTCALIYSMGWKSIKLYFMLGLPTETEADLQGIVETCLKIKRLPQAKGRGITASVSTFVPKPHTPFQWARQISRDETVARQTYLKEELRKHRIEFRYQGDFSTFLEGVIARAGEELAPALLRAYELGCRMDAWEGQSGEALWYQAFKETSIDPDYYLRERRLDEPLPWDHIDCRIPKKYFQREFQHSNGEKVTESCLHEKCSACTVCDFTEVKNDIFSLPSAIPSDPSNHLPPPSSDTKVRYRIRYSKRGVLRFVGHLEMSRLIERAVRRANLPIAYTGGFHPLPRISYGPPLQLGVESDAEYADFVFLSPVPGIAERLGSTLPPDIGIVNVEAIPFSAPSIQETIKGYHFHLSLLTDMTLAIAGGNDTFSGILQRRIRQEKRNREFVLKDYVSNLRILEMPSAGEGFTLSFNLSADSKRSHPRPSEIGRAITGLELGAFSLLKTDTIFAN